MFASLEFVTFQKLRLFLKERSAGGLANIASLEQFGLDWLTLLKYPICLVTHILAAETDSPIQVRSLFVIYWSYKEMGMNILSRGTTKLQGPVVQS